jgi:hypothetical protein
MDCPKTCVQLVNQNGTINRQKLVYTWKDLRETVREWREMLENVNFRNRLEIRVVECQ